MSVYVLISIKKCKTEINDAILRIFLFNYIEIWFNFLSLWIPDEMYLDLDRVSD